MPKFVTIRDEESATEMINLDWIFSATFLTRNLYRQGELTTWDDDDLDPDQPAEIIGQEPVVWIQIPLIMTIAGDITSSSSMIRKCYVGPAAIKLMEALTE